MSQAITPHDTQALAVDALSAFLGDTRDMPTPEWTIPATADAPSLDGQILLGAGPLDLRRIMLQRWADELDTDVITCDPWTVTEYLEVRGLYIGTEIRVWTIARDMPREAVPVRPGIPAATVLRLTALHLSTAPAGEDVDLIAALTAAAGNTALAERAIAALAEHLGGDVDSGEHTRDEAIAALTAAADATDQTGLDTGDQR